MIFFLRPAQVGREYESAEVRLQFGNESVLVSAEGALGGAQQGKVCGSGRAGDVDVLNGVEYEVQAVIGAASADVRGVHQCSPSGVHYRDERVGGTRSAECTLKCSRDDGEVRGGGDSHDVGVAQAVDHDLVGIVEAAPAQIGGVDKRRKACLNRGDERVVMP